jgi:hypothetical protein
MVRVQALSKKSLVRVAGTRNREGYARIASACDAQVRPCPQFIAALRHFPEGDRESPCRREQQSAAESGRDA